MKRHRGLAAAGCCVWFAIGGCKSDAKAAHHDVSDAAEHPAPDAGDAGAPTPLGLAIACNDNLESVYTPPAGLPPYSAAERGTVFRCATDQAFSVEDLQTILQDDSFVDVDVRSSVRSYRIAYRTDRWLGDEGRSAALVLLPDQPIAVNPPLVVFAHGFAGFGVDQTFSKLDPRASDPETGAALLLAAAGYPVIAPDYDGYFEGGLYADGIAEIEAHALLDSTRALHAILTPGSASDQVVVVGHSQGGHVALSAQAFATSYGMFGRLTALLVFAPGWFPARFYAASLAKGFSAGATDTVRLITATSYLYAHAEFYDGPGSGLMLFQPDKRDALSSIANSFAWIGSAGNTPYDFFEPAFLDSVATCALTHDPDDCSSDLAKTWTTRFRADRPRLDSRGPDVVLWAGAQDPAATPELVQCAIEKIRADFAQPGSTATFTACGDATADHQTIVSKHMSWASRFIAARTLGRAEPDACSGTDELKPATGTLTCPDPPGNAD